MLTIMDRELFRWMVYGSILVSGLWVSIAAWFPCGKRLADWLMVIGGTMVSLGIIGMISMYEVFELYDDKYAWLEHLVNGGLALGAILFAMGYGMDRANRRRVQDYQAHAAFPPPNVR